MKVTRKQTRIGKLLKKVQKQFDKWEKQAREKYGRYVIIDSYGTGQVSWTLKDAMDWLTYCSPDAAIVDSWKEKTIAKRVIN
jgi:hypothetical protein